MNSPDTATLPEIAGLVDLERYPIHHLESEPCTGLIADWKSELDNTGACNLPRFLSQAGTRELAAEAEIMLPNAYARTFTSNFCYENQVDPNLPDTHPKRRFWTTSSLHLASDQFNKKSKLRQLYEWDTLTELVARIQGKTKLYRDADEFQALNVIALAEGNRTIFHHDQVECVVTLLLQQPLAGGEFVYCADTRDANGSDDLEAISRVLNEEPGAVQQLDRAPGTLTLFRGGHTLHGVTPVCGEQKRITAVLSYDPRPDRHAEDTSNVRLYGPRVETILAERRVTSAPS